MCGTYHFTHCKEIIQTGQSIIVKIILVRFLFRPIPRRYILKNLHVAFYARHKSKHSHLSKIYSKLYPQLIRSSGASIPKIRDASPTYVVSNWWMWMENVNINIVQKFDNIDRPEQIVIYWWRFYYFQAQYSNVKRWNNCLLSNYWIIIIIPFNQKNCRGVIGGGGGNNQTKRCKNF